MKFESENPKLVLLLGACVATLIVVGGATVLPAQLAWFTGVAGTVLGAVGIQVNKKDPS